MIRFRHWTKLPPAGVPPGSLRRARSLAESLREHGELRRRSSIVGHRVHGAIHDHNYGSFRHWRLLYGGASSLIDVTPNMIRNVYAWPRVDVPIRVIKRVEPRARDLSVVDLKLRWGDRLRFWGEDVPELTVLLGWLVHRKVIAVPDVSVSTGQGSTAGPSSPFLVRAMEDAAESVGRK